MAALVVTFDDLVAAAAAENGSVEGARAALTAFLLDNFPGLLVSAGAASDMVLGPAATALAALQTAAEQKLADDDLETALEAGTDPVLLADALAARGVTPLPASAATGTVRIIVPVGTAAFQITPGLVLLSVAGRSYRPTGTTRFIPPETTPATGETVLLASPQGWLGTFAAAAQETGTADNLAAGSALAAAVTPVAGAGFVVATAFTGGRDAETAEEVLARLPEVGEATTAATAAGIRQLVNGVIPGATVRVVGYGHAAQLRGATALGIRLGGRVDVRTRPEGPLGSALVRVLATLVSTSGGVGTWRFTTTAGSPAAPAFVQRVWKDGSTPGPGQGYTITARSRAFDPTKVPAGADVVNAEAAAFTVAGRVTCDFQDTDTSLAGLTVGVSTKYYSSIVRYHTGIEAAQAALGGDAAPTAGDCLARGPTPVAVSITASGLVAQGFPEPNVSDVIASLVAGVNSSGITQTLTAGDVLAGTTEVLPAGFHLTSVNLAGTAHLANGTTVSFGSTQILNPGDVPASGLGQDVTAFYCDVADVSLTVVVP